MGKAGTEPLGLRTDRCCEIFGYRSHPGGPKEVVALWATGLCKATDFAEADSQEVPIGFFATVEGNIRQGCVPSRCPRVNG